MSDLRALIERVEGLFDKNGREIMRGDVLKVYHFTAALRRKKHYMYKQALGVKTLGSGTKYLMFGHLDMSDDYYVERLDGRTMPYYEIVQSIGCEFEKRPRATLRAIEASKGGRDG